MSSHGFVSGKGGKKKQKLRSMSAQLVAQHKQQKFIQKREENKFNKINAKKKGKRESGAKIPYNRFQHYLTIGEGNFSFTRALVQHFLQQQQQQQKNNTKRNQNHDSDEDNDDDEEADGDNAAGEENMLKVMDSFTAEEELERKRKAEATAAIAAGSVKKKMKREGAFDASVHIPKLPPGSVFTNPSCRVVATCYDSFSDLCFKYPDVPNKLTALVQANIPVFSGVDATALGRVRPHSVNSDMLERARKLELAEGKERNEARRKRLREAEEEEEYAHEREEEESDEDDESDDDDDNNEDDFDEDGNSDDQPKKKVKTEEGAAAPATKQQKKRKIKSDGGNFLFPPFVTRAAFQQIQQLLESKLHGSQKAKLQKRREEEKEQLNEAIKGLIAKNVAQMNPNAIPAAGAETAPAKKNKKKDKKRKANMNSISLLKSQHRASIVDRDLSQVNTRPRDRFHRVIFNFPHTGCGIKDTDRNNQVHREFLEQVFRSIVEQRLVYPADQHGEIHITLKKGEPYKSWNIQQIAKRVPGVSFKTSREFYTHLYPGYEHRRTRGWDAEKFDVDVGEDKGGVGVDLSTGKLLKPNADITGSGAMTYVFTRARTPADDEEDRFNTKWFTDYEVECEEERVRQELLEENDKIFQKVQQKLNKSNGAATTKVKHESDNEDMKAEQDDENDMEDAVEQEAEEEDEKEEEAEDEAEVEDADGEEEDESTPKLAPNFASAFKQHFQQASSAAAAPIQQKKPNALFQKSQKKGGFKQQQQKKKK